MVQRESRPPAIATRQAGAFTRDQAVAAGWTSRQVKRRIESGAWRYVAGCALTAAPQPDPPERRAWAGVLTWSDGVVGFEAAGAVHRFPPGRTPTGAVPVHVYLRSAHRPARGLVAVRRPLTTAEVTTRWSLRLTTAVRTAVDLLAHRPWDDALDLYAWLVSRRVLDHDALQRQVDRCTGRWGVPQLRRLVAFTADGAVSPAERLAHQILCAAGIDGWQSNVPIRARDGIVAVVDLLFPAARLVVEIDGWRAHGHRTAFQEDRRRQNLLMALGYRVLRFTWADLTERPDVVVDTIRAMLRASSSAV